MTARDRILARVRDALAEREGREHPGPFEGWRPEGADVPADTAFSQRFTEAGGEVVRVSSTDEARSWLNATARAAGDVVLGATLPGQLHPDAPRAPAESAALGISMARGAVAETGSLILDARDGRRAQLLPPRHVVIVDAGRVHATLVEALRSLADDLPSAVGLHSGPSKSADIGQMLVKGVHGPGRVVALIVGS
ncbi:MAG: LUD domain-containing protein [Gemmatimonadota bacterium]|jgi:L-lactate dehydrogenase complex protein LldG